MSSLTSRASPPPHDDEAELRQSSADIDEDSIFGGDEGQGHLPALLERQASDDLDAFMPREDILRTPGGNCSHSRPSSNQSRTSSNRSSPLRAGSRGGSSRRGGSRQGHRDRWSSRPCSVAHISGSPAQARLTSVGERPSTAPFGDAATPPQDGHVARAESAAGFADTPGSSAPEVGAQHSHDASGYLLRRPTALVAPSAAGLNGSGSTAPANEDIHLTGARPDGLPADAPEAQIRASAGADEPRPGACSEGPLPRRPSVILGAETRASLKSLMGDWESPLEARHPDSPWKPEASGLEGVQSLRPHQPSRAVQSLPPRQPSRLQSPWKPEASGLEGVQSMRPHQPSRLRTQDSRPSEHGRQHSAEPPEASAEPLEASAEPPDASAEPPDASTDAPGPPGTRPPITQLDDALPPATQPEGEEQRFQRLASVPEQQPDGDASEQRGHPELANASLRLITRTAAGSRTEEERQMLRERFGGLGFFTDLPKSVVAQTTDFLEWRRFEPGETVYSAGAPVTSVLLALTGSVTLEAGAHTVDKGMADTVGTRVSRPPGSVLGARELQERAGDTVQPEAWAGARYLWQAIAGERGAEVIAAPTAKLQELLVAHAEQERLEVLQTFPITAGMTREELEAPSRIERRGRKVTFHRLFDMAEVRRHQVFYQQGEQLPADQARIYFIVSGTVMLKSRGTVVDTLSEGMVFGDEALHGEPYEFTALCDGRKTKVLSISVADYRLQFLGNGNGVVNGVFARKAGRKAAPQMELATEPYDNQEDVAPSPRAALLASRVRDKALARRMSREASPASPSSPSRTPGPAVPSTSRPAPPNPRRWSEISEDLKRPLRQRAALEALREEDCKWQAATEKTMPRRRKPPPNRGAESAADLVDQKKAGRPGRLHSEDADLAKTGLGFSPVPLDRPMWRQLAVSRDRTDGPGVAPGGTCGSTMPSFQGTATSWPARKGPPGGLGASWYTSRGPGCRWRDRPGSGASSGSEDETDGARNSLGLGCLNTESARGNAIFGGEAPVPLCSLPCLVADVRMMQPPLGGGARDGARRPKQRQRRAGRSPEGSEGDDAEQLLRWRPVALRGRWRRPVLSGDCPAASASPRPAKAEELPIRGSLSARTPRAPLKMATSRL